MSVRIIVMALLVTAVIGSPRRVAGNDEAVGGPYVLETVLPAGGGTSTSPRFALSGSVGIAVTASSADANTTLQSGFWHALGAADRPDPLFSNGFE